MTDLNISFLKIQFPIPVELKNSILLFYQKSRSKSISEFIVSEHLSKFLNLSGNDFLSLTKSYNNYLLSCTKNMASISFILSGSDLTKYSLACDEQMRSHRSLGIILVFYIYFSNKSI